MPLISNIFHCISKNRILFCVLFFIISSFSLSAQNSPTVILTDKDDDNILGASDTVTITAAFSEAMIATPTISITGSVTDVAMTKISIAGNSSVVTQLGADIDGQRTNDDSGRSVSLSSDGLTVAIGSPEWENGSSFSEGKVAIYDYNGSAWVQVGGDIDGEAAQGYSIHDI